ncbi:MAG: nuclear transport factor 2 family protein [Gammaproteobacteria bacterium]
MSNAENLTFEQRLTRLEDYEKIKVLITRFARGADANCDPALLRPLFTDDAVFDVGQFGRLEGGDNIVNEMHSNVDIGFNNTLHFLVSPTIDIGEDLASAKCFYYLWETANHRTRQGENVAYWIGGWYDADVVKIGNEWRFRHLALSLKLLSSYAEGWHPLPNSFDDLG